MQAKQFFEYYNNNHDNIKFTIENEYQNKISFLDVTIVRNNHKLTTTVYRKPTFSGLGTNYFSNIYFKYKYSIINILLHRAYTISSSYEKFHIEAEFLRTFFSNNMYPPKLFNRFLYKFLNRKCDTNNNTIPTVNRNQIYLCLPYIGSQTNKLKSELLSLVNKYYPQLDCRFYCKNSSTISSLFNKTMMRSSTMTRASVVYEYKCDCCLQSYIGSTIVQMFIRCAGHCGTSYRTNKPYKIKQKSSIRDHCDKTGHCIKLDNFHILDSCNNSETDLRILESIYIKKHKPSLNNYLTAYPLNIT